MKTNLCRLAAYSLSLITEKNDVEFWSTGVFFGRKCGYEENTHLVWSKRPCAIAVHRDLATVGHGVGSASGYESGEECPK